MINRRGAIVAIGAAAIGAAPSSSALVRLLQSGMAQGGNPTQGKQNDSEANIPANSAANKAIDDRLRQDLAAPTAYSEEGVPVFLACVDLVAERASQKAKVTLTAFNATFASELRKNSESWKRIHPDAPEGDVAKVIEVLAHRDFDHDALEQKR